MNNVNSIKKNHDEYNLHKYCQTCLDNVGGGGWGGGQTKKNHFGIGSVGVVS